MSETGCDEMKKKDKKHHPTASICASKLGRSQHYALTRDEKRIHHG